MIYGNCEDLSLIWHSDLNLNTDKDSWAKTVSVQADLQELGGKFTQ